MMKWLLIVMIASLSQFAVAEEAENVGPCHNDVQTLCKDIKPGGGRIIKCLKENEAKLSAECKAHQEKRKEQFKEAKEVCAEDMKKHCADVKPGGGARAKCMRENKDKFSQACQDSMKNMRGPGRRK